MSTAQPQAYFIIQEINMGAPSIPAPSAAKLVKKEELSALDTKKANITDLDSKANVAPDYYYVIVVAGQSNTSYGEGQAFPDTWDAEHPRIKQLARRSNTKTSSTIGNKACTYNDIIPLDWCPHGVDDMASKGHSAAIAADGRQYGTFSFMQSMAKRLLPTLPSNAGILIVSSTRGGSAFTQGTDQTYDAAVGAPTNATRWGITGGLAGNGNKTALYLDMRDRTKAALNKNPKNVLLGVVWLQGEFDQTGTPGNHKSMFEAMVGDFRTELNSTHRKQCLGFDAIKVPWLCGDSTIYFQSSVANFTQVYEGTYLNTSLANLFYVQIGKDEQGNWTATNAVADDPDITDAAGTKIYFGSASRTSSDWISSTRNSHFSSWAHRTIIAERMAAAIIQTTNRLLPGITPQEAGGIPRDYVQDVVMSGSNLSISKRNDITGENKKITIPIPATSVVNYTPSVLSIGYNSRRGTGTMKDQGFTGSLEFAANTAAIAGATVIDGAVANNAFTLTNAIAHPDSLGGYTYRHSVSAVGNGEWYKASPLSIADLAKLITYGGFSICRAKITDAYAAQFMAALVAMIHKGNALLPAAALTGITGTDNGKVSLLCHFIQAKLNGAVNSIYLSAWINGGNVDLVSIPYDNAYHDYKMIFAGGNTAVVTPMIDSVAGTPRALFYGGAANVNYSTPAAADTTSKVAITDISGSSITLGFNLDALQFVIYQDDGTIALSNVDANHSVTLQGYSRNHTITIPDFAIGAGKSLTINAQNIGNVVIKGANSNVLIQPLGGTTPLPSAVTITRANTTMTTYIFVQTSADGKTWQRIQ
jgi:transposase InsO family protein